MIRQFEAQNISDTELQRWGLWSKGWRTNFTKHGQWIAACFFDEKRIVISIPHLNARSEAELIQTVKHEIAHALAGFDAGHGDKWVEEAKKVGIDNPVACIKGFTNVDKGQAISPVEVKEAKPIKALKTLCPKCQEPFVVTSQAQMGGKIWMKGQCGHLVSKEQLHDVNDLIAGWSNVAGTKTLYPYQVEGIRFIGEASGRALVADEPGLGKTIQALGSLYFYKEMRPALWVCKSNLTLQTVKEAIEWCGAEMMGQVIKHGKTYIIPNLNLYVISMDLLRRMPEEKILEIPYKTVIADEIQHFKNPDSTRTAELRKLVAKAEYFIPLSGTPWKNRGSEYFPVLNMLRPEMFPSPKHFKNNWVDVYFDAKSNKYREGGIKNIPAFREKTKSFIIRRMRDDVLPDLPKTDRRVRLVDMDEEAQKLYDKSESRVAAMIKAAMIDDKPMSAIAGMIMELKHITGLAKVPTIIDDVTEWLENTEDYDKITIFHHHIDVGDLIQKGHTGEYDGLDKWLVDNGYNKTLRMLGGRTPEEREGIKERFKNDPRNRVLVASTLASGEGLNLQFCQNAYMGERQWNPQNEEQAEFRFSRPLTWADYPKYLQDHLFNENKEPKKVSIRIPYYIAAGTVDEILTDIVERKRHNFRKSMNEKDAELKWDENEIIREVAEAIIKKRYKK
jgi:hypothetical protein